MTGEKKIEYMLNDLAQRGVPKLTAAPLAYRLLWRLGFDPAPPLFATFWSTACLTGIGWSILMVPWMGLWGIFMILMGLTTWREWPMMMMSLIIPLILGGGAMFGLIMAAYFQWRMRKLGLPRWEDYSPDPTERL